MKNLQVPPVTYEMARSLVKVLKVRNQNEVANVLIQREFKEKGLWFMNSYLRTLDQLALATKDLPTTRPEERRSSQKALILSLTEHR